MEQENRVVVLIDMDCFYCQVEEKLDPELKGKPIAVVQYNPWKGGGIIAVNYVARARGVTRHMRGDEAKEKCPEIQLPSVPCQRGKADISKYREAGKEVARVLQRFTRLLERASIDEAYLDITAPVEERLKTLNINTVTTDMIPNTYALGYDSIDQFMSDVHSCGSDSIDFEYEHAKRLLVGAVIVSEIRAAVYQETGYRCSAGISHNKILAKLVCGMNKPDKQTVLPKHSINILYKTLSVKKVKHLGGKFGDTVCEVLKISKMCELQKFTEKELQARFDEKNGTWLYKIARGVDAEPVQARFNPKSVGCCKQLRGKSALHDLHSLNQWLRDLGDEIEDRLEKDAVESNRTPRQMVVSFSTQGPGGRVVSSSRSYNFAADDELCGELFARKALELVLDSLEGAKCTGEEGNRKLKSTITFLGISVGKFEDHSETKKTRKIVDFFAAGALNTIKTKDETKTNINKEENVKKNEGKEYLLQKYFQAVDKGKTLNAEVKADASNTLEQQCDRKLEFPLHKQKADNVSNTLEQNKCERKLESPLDKQESFFAKLLNKNNSTSKNAVDNDKLRPTTPVCNIVPCGDDSNASNYSSSTIDKEINTSIALFEDDPQDIARVSNMRELLNNSLPIEEKSNEDLHSDKTDDRIDEIVEKGNSISNNDVATKCSENEQNNTAPKEETFKCNECGKTIPLCMFETHADYHFALKLREEERRRVRDEKTSDKKDKTLTLTKEEGKKKRKDDQKNNTAGAIASFFVKIDDSIPTETCSVCKRKIPVEKFSEHSDFHEAQKLNRELNKKPAISSILGSGVKRKRKSVSPKKATKLSCTSNSKSIESFFR